MHKMIIVGVLFVANLSLTSKSFGCEDHKEGKTTSQKSKSARMPTEESVKKSDKNKPDAIEEFSDAVNRNAEILAGAAVDAAVRIKKQMNPQSKAAE